MKFFIKFKFIFTLICILIYKTLCFKPDNKKTDINQNNIEKNKNYRKECKITEKCRECTFDELKNLAECQYTAYKRIKICIYYDEKKLVDEIYFTEQCSENMKMNSVYIFLIICIFTGVLSFYIRKSHKSFILNQTLEKLTILRKHN